MQPEIATVKDGDNRGMEEAKKPKHGALCVKAF